MVVATALFARADRRALPARAPRASRRCGSRSARRSRCSRAACRSTSALGDRRSARCVLARAARRRARRGARAGLACCARWRARSPARSSRSRALAWALAGARRRARAAASRSPARALRADRRCSRVAFPEGGTQPFVASAFYPALAAVARDRRAGAAARSERALRIGALLYALALIGAYVAADAGRRQRRPARRARRPGPLARAARCSSAARAGRRRGARCARCVAARAAAAVLAGATRRSPTSSRPPRDPARRTPPTTRRCSASCARSASATARARRASRSCRRATTGRRAGSRRTSMLARGWERQLDRYRNALFYDAAPLDAPRATARGCARTAVSYVALPDAPLDYSARAEARLRARAAPRYLREVWRSRHWRLFAVRGAAPLAQPPRALHAARQRLVHAARAARRRRYDGARALHALLGARRAGAAACARGAGRLDATVQARARAARCASAIALLARRACFDHGPRCAEPSLRRRLGFSAMVARARRPAGARPAARLARRAAAGLAVRRRVLRLPARARAGRGRRQRGVRARARPDLARAQRCTCSSSRGPGLGVGQPLRDGQRELAVRQRADVDHARARCCTCTCATTAASTSCATCS